MTLPAAIIDLAANTRETYDSIKATWQAGELGQRWPALTSRERVAWAVVMAERNGRSVEWNLEELERRAATQTRAAIAAQAERDAVLAILDELIIETDAEAYVRAREDVLAGTTWQIEAGALYVRRPGRDAHRVSRDGCDCPARVLCRHQALRLALVRLHRRQQAVAA